MTKYFQRIALIGLGCCFGLAAGFLISGSLSELLKSLMTFSPVLLWLPVFFLSLGAIYIVTLDAKK